MLRHLLHLSLVVATTGAFAKTTAGYTPPPPPTLQLAPTVVAPSSISLTEVGDGQVRVSWVNAGNVARVDIIAGPSTSAVGTSVVRTLASQTYGTTTTTTLPVRLDATTCFWVKVINGSESATTRPRCISTRDGLHRPLWRAQVRIDVANVADGGTDSAINVGLNSRFEELLPRGGNLTWIDSPTDDFEAGDRRTYDVRTNGVGDISDVHMLLVENDGSDGVCVENVELWLNEQPAFRRRFSPCQWLDNSRIGFGHADLRASPDWQALTARGPTLPMPYAQLDSVVTASVGHALHGTNIDFNDDEDVGGSGVDSRHRSYSYDFTGDYYFPATLSFELESTTTCVGDRAEHHLTMVNDHVTADWIFLLAWPIAQLVVELTGPSIPSSWTDISFGTCANGRPEVVLCMMHDGVMVQSSDDGLCH